MSSLDEIKNAIRNNEIHDSYKGAKFKAQTTSNIHHKDSIRFRVYVRKAGTHRFIPLGGDQAYEFASESEADFAAKALNFWAGN